MTGAILNAVGILIGGLIGLSRSAPLSAKTSSFFQLVLGVLTVFYGLRLAWISIGGSAGLVLKQICIAFLAVMFGKLLGHWLHLQAGSNCAGQYARKLIEQSQQQDALRFSNGLTSCAILFCASPLGILGAIQDGLPGQPDGRGYYYPLAVKAVMDALAMISFVRLFGTGAVVSALPVFLFQGTLTLSCAIYLQPFLQAHQLLDSVNAVGGLLLCTVGLVIFEIRRVELADFLPALAVAPVLTWFWR